MKHNNLISIDSSRSFDCKFNFSVSLTAILFSVGTFGWRDAVRSSIVEGNVFHTLTYWLSTGQFVERNAHFGQTGLRGKDGPVNIF